MNKNRRVAKKIAKRLQSYIPHTPAEAIETFKTARKIKGRWDSVQRKLQPLKTFRNVVNALRLCMGQLSEGLQKEGITMKQALPGLQSKNPYMKKILRYMKMQ